MVHGCFILLFYMVYSNRCSKWNTTLCEVQLMLVLLIFMVQLFHDGGRYIETSPMDWFLCNNGLRHERVNRLKKQKFEYDVLKTCLSQNVLQNISCIIIAQ